jgi:hypothetical protein
VAEARIVPPATLSIRRRGEFYRRSCGRHLNVSLDSEPKPRNYITSSHRDRGIPFSTCIPGPTPCAFIAPPPHYELGCRPVGQQLDLNDHAAYETARLAFISSERRARTVLLEGGTYGVLSGTLSVLMMFLLGLQTNARSLIITDVRSPSQTVKSIAIMTSTRKGWI